MTPKEADIWKAYHHATEMLADATEDLILAHECRRAGLICNCADQEAVVLELLANYRACRAAVEAMR